MDSVYYFRFVRDIPFTIPLRVDEPDHCCVGKHIVLQTLLTSLGLKVRYRICQWSWSSLDLPKAVKAIPHEDLCGHVYLEVYNRKQDRWMLVDATWDKRLASKFVISDWEGESDTDLAVKPTKISDKMWSHLSEQSEAQIAKEIRINGEFFKAVNKWLESVRAET